MSADDGLRSVDVYELHTVWAVVSPLPDGKHGVVAFCPTEGNARLIVSALESEYEVEVIPAGALPGSALILKQGDDRGERR